jgi:hypothetical protein
LHIELTDIVVCVFARHCAKAVVLSWAWQRAVGDWLLVQTAVSVSGCFQWHSCCKLSVRMM